MPRIVKGGTLCAISNAVCSRDFKGSLRLLDEVAGSIVKPVTDGSLLA